MSDFRLDPGFLKHPKTQKLVRRLGPAAPLRLIELWAWAVDNRPSGELTDMDAEDIHIAAGASGDAEDFVNALVDLRWLDASDAGYALHNWRERQPWASNAESRSAAAKASGLMSAHARGAHAEKAHTDCPACIAATPRKRSVSKPSTRRQRPASVESNSSPLPSSPILSVPSQEEEKELRDGSANRARPPDPQKPDWPEDLTAIRDLLTTLHAPEVGDPVTTGSKKRVTRSLWDPEYWRGVDVLYGPDDAPIAYFDELKKYLVWWFSKGASERHIDMKDAMNRWFNRAAKDAANHAAREAQRKEHGHFGGRR